MKRLIPIPLVSLIAALTLAGCTQAVSAPPAAPTHVAEASPTPAEARVPERVEFQGPTISYVDLAAVADRGDEPVILLPNALGASVLVEGVTTTWWVESAFPSGLGGVDVNEFDPGVLTVKPLAGYDSLADPKDFVRSSDGTITFKTSPGNFSVRIEGVDP